MRHQASCHPDQPEFGDGLCHTCYVCEYLTHQPAYVTRGLIRGRYPRYPGLDAKTQAQMHLLGCEVCGRHDGKMCNDHCHETGRLRGTLCVRCNTGLGMFLDSSELLRRAAEYVDQDRDV